ncbi:hypothetical protein VNI00_006095 [Paramarasmius palmivorus]|uniref:Uncharacterized protein n=1 Tax=Paramarasmius palmivorus TaxID=297713 RepID=A0AAW0D8Z4_9AGAR
MYSLSLNRAALLLIPPQAELGTEEPYVVQVIVKSTGGTHEDRTRRYLNTRHPRSSIFPEPDVIAAYFFVQSEVTNAVRNLVIYDLVSSNPVPCEKQIIIKGNGYALHGAKKRWSIFDQVDGALGWGCERVRVVEHKWVFELELERELWKETDWDTDETLVTRSDESEVEVEEDAEETEVRDLLTR